MRNGDNNGHQCHNCRFWERRRAVDGVCTLPESTQGRALGMYYDGLTTLQEPDLVDISLITLDNFFCAAWRGKVKTNDNAG